MNDAEIYVFGLNVTEDLHGETQWRQRHVAGKRIFNRDSIAGQSLMRMDRAK